MARTQLANFDDRAAEWIRDLEQKTGQNILWYDMYLKRPHLVENPKYHKYKINVRVENVRYNAATSDVKKPGFVYTEWFHNGQTTAFKHKFQKSTEFMDTYTWSLTNTIAIGLKTSFSVGLPKNFGVSGEISSNFSLESTKSETQTKKETFSSQIDIMVQPQTSVKVVFTVNEREMVVPWEADVFIGGYIAVWFERKYDDHYLWFYPITSLANQVFKIHNGSELWYQNKGKFIGVHGIESDVRIEEYPLQTGMIQGSTDEPAASKMLSCSHIVGKTTASSVNKLSQIPGDE